MVHFTYNKLYCYDLDLQFLKVSSKNLEDNASTLQIPKGKNRFRYLHCPESPIFAKWAVTFLLNNLHRIPDYLAYSAN